MAIGFDFAVELQANEMDREPGDCRKRPFLPSDLLRWNKSADNNRDMPF